MKTVSRFEGVIRPALGYESNYLEPVDTAKPLVGICDLLEEAIGHEVPSMVVYKAFEYAYDSFWQSYIDDYQETGQKWPPLYHVWVALETEQLSDEEIEAYWVSQLRESSNEFNQ